MGTHQYATKKAVRKKTVASVVGQGRPLKGCECSRTHGAGSAAGTRTMSAYCGCATRERGRPQKRGDLKGRGLENLKARPRACELLLTVRIGRCMLAHSDARPRSAMSTLLTGGHSSSTGVAAASTLLLLKDVSPPEFWPSGRCN